MRNENVNQAESPQIMRIDAKPVAGMACGMSDHAMLGDVVKKERIRKGMTQADLANKAGLSMSIIQKIERTGGGTRPTHRAIAEALGLTLDQFDAHVAAEADTISVHLPRYAYEHAVEQATRSKVETLDWILKRLGLSNKLKTVTPVSGEVEAKQKRVLGARHQRPQEKSPQK